MSSLSDSPTPLAVRRQIDAICREFESQWKSGSMPSLEEFLSRITPAFRQQLLRELIVVECEYRRNGCGGKLTNYEICALHPDLMPGLSEQLKSLSGRGNDLTEVHDVSSPDRQDQDETPYHTPQRGSSRGLSIRCPHCSNPVELLSDTSIDSITCVTCGSAFSLVDNTEATRMAPTLKRIGRFEIVSRLGVGGFGTVWKARDTELDRAVAIKIPRKGQLELDELKDFYDEAQTTAQLRHPNIVPVYEVGKEEDTVFIVSELVRGVSLSDWLSGISPDWRQIAEIMVKVAQALDHAHEKGVIHRDLKPSNILMDEQGQPNVMDFGLAKRVGNEITMTVDGQILGTPAYMSPEQAAGHSHWTDRRMDIYSFGVVFYRMLTGELPYRGNAQIQIHQRLTVDAPDPRTLNKYIPKDLATICLKCLERDPNNRYLTASKVAEELERYLRGEPILARPISRLERAIRWAKRKPALATAAGLGVILAIVGPTTAVIIESQRQRQVALVHEKDNLIKARDQENREAMALSAELQDKLDVWEGRANPWEFWPPDPSEPPKRQQLASLLAARGVSLENSKESESESELEKAQRLLASAILNEAANNSATAKENFEAASQVLEGLHQASPGLQSVTLALADCYDRLSALVGDKEDAESSQWLAKAVAVRRKLAEQQRKDPLVQALRQDAELRAGLEAGFASATEQLTHAQQINSQLTKLWPKSPAEIYRLACQLAGRPMLLEEEPVRTGENTLQPIPELPPRP